MITSGPSGADGPHLIVDSVDQPVANDDDRHHFERVLRLAPGASITVGDGVGAWRTCRWGDSIEIVGELHHVPAPNPRLGVAFALIKGGRPELVVQKLVELGVNDIRPFRAERSVVRWDDAKAQKNHTRLQKVAREATMQCRRAWLPDVHPIADFADVASLEGSARADMGGGPIEAATRTVLVGPEGGWTEAERAVDLPVVRLSSAVLRAETAAIAAGVLLTAQREVVGSG